MPSTNSSACAQQCTSHPLAAKYYGNGAEHGKGYHWDETDDMAGDHDGKDKPGRITHIYCYTDPAGMIVGMAYKNEWSGYKTFCDRPHGGYYGENCGAGCSSLVLGPVENIIKIEACRGGK